MTGIINYLANPGRFRRVSQKIYPWSLGSTVLFLLLGLWFALYNSPPDYQQGETVRIMYIHVPAAWMSLFIYSTMVLLSIFSLVWKHPLADLLCKSSAPIGACFTLIALVTGSIWGKPTWGTWWVWDARLTSVFILFLIYMGHIGLVRSIEDHTKSAKAAAILTLIGAINIPIIKFSVDWWNTLHQPASIIRVDGPTIHSSMLLPLILMAISFMSFYFSFVLLNTQTELYKRRLKTIFVKSLIEGKK